MPRPTPGGVPVVITSPGSSVMYCDTSATSSATPKIIVFVLPRCRLLAVDVEPHVEVLHVLDLVPRHHPRARSGRTCRSPCPCSTATPLCFIWKSRSDTSLIDAVARDVAHRVLLVDVARLAADDDRRAPPPSRWRRVLRHHHVVVRADDARLGLEEHDRVLGDRRARFLGVVDVVQADRDELATAWPRTVRGAACPSRAAASSGRASRASASSPARATRRRCPSPSSTGRAACRRRR